jgi:hypothetical protein
MKQSVIITILAAALCTSTSLFGKEDENKDKTKTETKVTTTRIIMKESESVQDAIDRTLKEAKIDIKEIPADSVTDTTIKIDKDGKTVVTQIEGGEDSEDIGKAIKEAIKKALKQGEPGELKTEYKVSTTTVLIGPDGKKIDLKEGESLSDGINKMIQDAVQGQGGITSIGPAFVAGSGETAQIITQLKELKKEMAEQRKILEAISKKLE